MTHKHAHKMSVNISKWDRDGV